MGKFLDAVEEKIETLTKNVEALGDDGFNERTRLDVHDLLCTLRLAIWEDEASFVDWLDGKTHEINPNILTRIILKGGEKDAQGNSKDGVELRFHIFKDGNETFKHNHRQDFITIPLTGSYRYTWWLEDATQDGEYFVWERAKGGDLTPKGTKKASCFQQNEDQITAWSLCLLDHPLAFFKAGTNRCSSIMNGFIPSNI